MTNNEWERGTFKLPSSEFASFRQAVQDSESARKQQIFDMSQEFWKGLTRKQQTDPWECKNAVDAFISSKGAEDVSEYNGWNSVKVPKHDSESLDELDLLLQRKAGGKRWSGVRELPAEKPTRVLKADVEFPTNRSTAFQCGDATVVFDKANKTVTWATTHNNHSVERAHETPLARTFWDRFNKVRWTHGTGGSLAYHSEHHDEDASVGGGANTCTGAYGYLGITQNPANAMPFTNAKGERIGSNVKWNRFGQLVGKPMVIDRHGNPVKKAPARKPAPAGRAKTTAASTAGSFATQQRGEATDVRL